MVPQREKKIYGVTGCDSGACYVENSQMKKTVLGYWVFIAILQFLTNHLICVVIKYAKYRK